MFQGRFKKTKPEKSKKGSMPNEDGGSPARSTAAPSSHPGVEDIAFFFENELNRYLNNKCDRSLFLKIVTAEGFASRLQEYKLFQ